MGQQTPDSWCRVCILLSGFRPPSCSYSCRYFLGQLCLSDKPKVGLPWEEGRMLPPPNKLLLSARCWSNTHVAAWTSMLVLNPALFATSLGLNPVSPVETSASLCWPWISLLQVILSPCDVDTSTHCHPVLLSVAALSGITMGFRSEKNHRPQETVDEKICCLKFPADILSWSAFAA